MHRTTLLLLLGLCPLAVPAAAAPRTEVPVTRDLREAETLDQELGPDPSEIESSNETPTNPDGVVGYDGPPGGGMDDGVDYGSPLPPGSIGDLDDN